MTGGSNRELQMRLERHCPRRTLPRGKPVLPGDTFFPRLRAALLFSSFVFRSLSDISTLAGFHRFCFAVAIFAFSSFVAVSAFVCLCNLTDGGCHVGLPCHAHDQTSDRHSGAPHSTVARSASGKKKRSSILRVKVADEINASNAQARG